MRVERLDLDGDGEPYARLVADARAESTPAALRRPVAYTLKRLRHMSSHRRAEVWGAWRGGALAGAVEAAWLVGLDNADRTWLAFDVPPGAREPALLDALGRAAAASSLAGGRTVLNVDVPAGTPLSAWVREHGGLVGSVEEYNVCRVRSLDRTHLAALATRGAEGYEVLTFDRGVPDDLMDAYVALRRALADAPTDDLTMEAPVVSAERLRAWEAGLAARGHTPLAAVARSLETGELAGFNQVVVRPEWPEAVENEDTAVAPAHRGRGLGLWVKAVNLLRVVDETDAVCVDTWNARSNTHMLRVNRRLGFRCQHVWESCELAAEAVA